MDYTHLPNQVRYKVISYSKYKAFLLPRFTRMNIQLFRGTSKLRKKLQVIIGIKRETGTGDSKSTKRMKYAADIQSMANFSHLEGPSMQNFTEGG